MGGGRSDGRFVVVKTRLTTSLFFAKVGRQVELDRASTFPKMHTDIDLAVKSMKFEVKESILIQI